MSQKALKNPPDYYGLKIHFILFTNHVMSTHYIKWVIKLLLFFLSMLPMYYSSNGKKSQSEVVKTLEIQVYKLSPIRLCKTGLCRTWNYIGNPT